ncbi:MAG: FAD:protein FMN transferase [Dehalococcoidia bacterium]
MNAAVAAPVRSRRVTRIFMDTPVTVELVGCDRDAIARIDAAFQWFEVVERTCSRFDPESELSQLAARIGEPVPVTRMLAMALDFAVEMAHLTGGAFDPTLGRLLAEAGFDRNHRTGRHIQPGGGGSVEDVVVDVEQNTVLLRKPVALDLGAVAKGLAVDLAARELAGAPGFVVDAGGDVCAGGHSSSGQPWRIGIRHPRDTEQLIDTVVLRDAAICTSGDYERRTPAGHHLLEPQSGRSASGLASVSVIAPSAMLADALSTAAFVLGPEAGAALLEREGAAGLLILPDLTTIEAGDFARYRP